MGPKELRELIDRYLALIEGPIGDPAGNEEQLVVLLDELALAAHRAPPGEVMSDEPGPSPDERALRQRIGERFPDYGHYQTARPAPDEEFLVGDAIDDVVDITKDLMRTRWLWQHVGEPDALWYFHHSYRTHWREHLRGLQLFICQLRADT